MFKAAAIAVRSLLSARPGRRRAAFIFALALAALAGSGWAIPPEVAVTGYLTEGAPPTPVTGNFALRVIFYDSQACTHSLATVTTAATVQEGVLNATIKLPEDLLGCEELWYKVDLDRDGNGFDVSDRFGETVRLTSVPYALSAQPVRYFESHGGQGGYNQFGAQSSENTPGRIVLAPFTTPAGGVKFNRIAASFGFDSTAATSFGVYDAQGNLIYCSPKLTGPRPASVLAFEVKGRLRPSTIYYTALITTAARTPGIGIIMLPTLPTRGIYMSASRDGSLPKKIDMSQIQFSSDYRPISISFFMAEDIAQPTQKLSLGKGISYAPDKP